jgi:UDP-3-O-[3-hydroxymyristoyl] glucosamine N-acyltransferase
LIESITGDPRFFARCGPFSLAEVAQAAGIELTALEGKSFVGVAPLQLAGPRHVSFLNSQRYEHALAATRAGAVLLEPAMVARVPAGTVALPTANPVRAWAEVATLFHPAPVATPGIHPTAVIDPTAIIGEGSEIGPLAVIGARAEIGRGCRIGPLVAIGEGVVLGAECRIGAGASISYSLIGARVYIYPGARLGQEGFGFDAAASGFKTVPQLGRVIIEDDVEVGANSTIDRGSAQDTVIGAGTRLDNLVQIGHNVRVGRGCIIVAQVGISGSTTLGDHVVVGGQVGMAGHLKIGRGARIGAQAGVMADLEAGAEVVGTPAEPIKDFFRQVAFIRRLVKRSGAAGSGTGAD